MSPFDPSDPRGKTVLVVDDDDNIRSLFEILIKTGGFQVIIASSGEEAIEKLSEKPDALLLDLIMPGCGGLGVLKHLKTVTGPLPVVIVITAYESRHPAVLEAVMDPNVTQCLGKPVNTEVLLGALHRYLKTESRKGPEEKPSAINLDPTISEAVTSAKPEDNAFFKNFSQKSRARLMEAAKTETLADGAVLFSEGEPSEWVYLLCSGRVDIIKPLTGAVQPGAPWAVLATVEPGDYFGEIGVLDMSPRNTGARARGPAAVRKVPCDEVRRALEEEPAQVTMQLMMRFLKYLRTTNEKLIAEIVRKEKMGLIGEVAGSILHDFQNPLTAIHGEAQSIIKTHQDEPTVKSSRMIQAHADRMAGIALELLEFARGTPKLNKKPLPLKVLFETFRQLNEKYLERARVKLNLTCDGGEATVDIERLLRVLQNLVGNSVDAMPDGGEIALAAARKNGAVEITVSDDGPGIPGAIRHRLFEPFVTYGKKDGTGLGLVIAKGLVEAHGGKLSLTPAPRGATFLIQLPS